MTEPHQKITVRLPTTFSSNEILLAGEKIIELIQERTRKGLDKNGNKFAGYSSSYKESKDFDIAGKTNLVNLTLSGDMLRNLEILGSGKGFVTVGFETASDANDKASYARDFGNGPSRQFLGISDKELKIITDNIETDQLDSNVRGLIRNFPFNLFS